MNEANVVVSQRAVFDKNGNPVDGLHNVWITLNNPKELNSYTTAMIPEVIAAFRAASNDPAAVGLAKALRKKVAEDKLALEIRTDPRSIYAGALGAALWAAFRHNVLAGRAGVPPAGPAASRRREVPA